MSISSELRKAGPYAGNDVTTSFPFSFKVFSAGDVVVVRTNTSGVETALTIGTDYSVTLNADQDTSPGGSIVLPAALASGFLLTLTSSVPNLQPVMLTNQGGFYPRVINDALDRLTILMQQLSEKLSRALSVPISSAVSSALPPPAANHVLGWDATGAALTNLTSLAEGTTVSSAMHPVVTAASLASARATLDVRSSAESLAFVAPGTGGNTLISNGTSWISLPNQQLNAFTASVAANALTISAGTLALAFRSPSLSDGSITTVVGDPADLVISNGSTLGTSGYNTERLAVLAILHSTDTIELAVTRITQGKLLQESSLISTTAEAGNADSGNLVYSTTARTNRPFRILGYIESVQINAGMWAAAPTVIQNASAFTPIQDICSQFARVEQGLSDTVTDITGLPIWAREITIHFESLGTSGTSLPIIQLGSDGGWSSFNYDARGAALSAAGNTLSAAITSGFPLDGVWSSSARVTGTMTLHASGSYWYEHFVGARVNATPTAVHSAGYLLPITSDPINKVRITTLGGTDTFASGYISVKARA